MTERRRELEESARFLRARLGELERAPVQDRDRPIHEVAIQAVRTELSAVGRQLMRLAFAY